MKKLFKAAMVAACLVAVGAVGKAQQKLAHINSGELLEAMPEMKVAEAAYNAFQKQKSDALALIDAERIKKTNLYNEKYKTLSEANKDILTKELNTLVTEIQDLEKRIQDGGTKAQEDVNAKYKELYQPVFDKASTAIKAVGKEKGFDYVLDSNQQTLLYFNDSLDILPLVKAKLGISATAAPAASTAPGAKKP